MVAADEIEIMLSLGVTLDEAERFTASGADAASVFLALSDPQVGYTLENGVFDQHMTDHYWGRIRPRGLGWDIAETRTSELDEVDELDEEYERLKAWAARKQY